MYINSILKYVVMIFILLFISCNHNNKQTSDIKQLQIKQVELSNKLELIKQKIIVMESILKQRSVNLSNKVQKSSYKKQSSVLSLRKNNIKYVNRNEPDPSQLPTVKLIPKQKSEIYQNPILHKYKRSGRYRRYKRLRLTLKGTPVNSTIQSSKQVMRLGKYYPLKEPKRYKNNNSNNSNVVTTYKKAMQYMKQKQYIFAITLFNQIYIKHSSHSYADNALFWIGMCYFKQKHYKKAMQYFDKVINKYPKGNKVPDALLKKALCYLNLNLSNFAKKILIAILKQYPSSTTSDTANKVLATLR